MFTYQDDGGGREAWWDRGHRVTGGPPVDARRRVGADSKEDTRTYPGGLPGGAEPALGTCLYESGQPCASTSP